MRIPRRSLAAWPAPRLSAAFIALVTLIGLSLAGLGAANAGAVLPDVVSAAALTSTPNVFPGDASTGVTNGCSTTWFGTQAARTVPVHGLQRGHRQRGGHRGRRVHAGLPAGADLVR